MHLTFMEQKGQPPRHAAVVLGESEEDTRANFGLLQLGITPPVGTEIAHYLRVAQWEDEVMYIYLGSTGGDEIQAED